MHKGLVITGAVLAAATLCLAFAAWMAGPGQWRAVLAVLAAMSGLGVAAVWFATVVVFDLSGRDEWIVTCLAVSALALAFGVFKLGPTTGALVLGLGSGPLVATLSVIRQVSWGQWPGWSSGRASHASVSHLLGATAASPSAPPVRTSRKRSSW